MQNLEDRLGFTRSCFMIMFATNYDLQTDFRPRMRSRRCKEALKCRINYLSVDWKTH